MLSTTNNVEIVTSDFSHDLKRKKDQIEESWPFTITFMPEAGYKKNISVKRFFSHYVWGKNVRNYLNRRKKPDVIYCAIPSLTAAAEASKYCKKNGVRFIIDIQDLWPEAFRMVFNIPVLSNVLFYPFMKIANSIYKGADEICGVSQSYVDRALSVNRKCEKGHVVFLGTKLRTFDENAKTVQPMMKKPKGETWIGYCGSLAASYDIPCIISAIKKVDDYNQNTLKFIVMGDGDRASEFKSCAIEHGVDVVFLGRLPYDQMCAQLVQCDIVVNPIVKGSAASIINKHGDYAASGKPVINTQDSQEYRNLVDEYHMGFNCENGNADSVAEKLRLLLNNGDLRSDMGNNARRCADEKFNRENSYRELLDCITK